MVTAAAARLMNLDGYGVAVGNSADSSSCPAPAGAAVAELARPLFGLERGRRSFFNPPGQLFEPAAP